MNIYNIFLLNYVAKKPSLYYARRHRGEFSFLYVKNKVKYLTPGKEIDIIKCYWHRDNGPAYCTTINGKSFVEYAVNDKIGNY